MFEKEFDTLEEEGRESDGIKERKDARQDLVQERQDAHAEQAQTAVEQRKLKQELLQQEARRKEMKEHISSEGEQHQEEDDPKSQSTQPGTPSPPPRLPSAEALAAATAAATAAAKRERELVSDLGEMTRKFIELKMQLDEEQSNVALLSGASGKKKLANEAVRLRQVLERRSRDVQAALLKGQELHMMNKTLAQKLENREQHVQYLVDSLADMQNAHKQFVMDSRLTNIKLREENKRLRKALDSAEDGAGGQHNPQNKVVVPIRGGGGSKRRGSDRKSSCEDAKSSMKSGKKLNFDSGLDETWSPLKDGAVPVMSGELKVEKTEAYFGEDEDEEDWEDDDSVYARAAAATAKAIQMQKKSKKKKRLVSGGLKGLKTLMPKRMLFRSNKGGDSG